MKRLLAVLVLAASLGIVSASPAKAATNLTLINGWSQYPEAATPAVSIDNGVVHFQGAITAGSDPRPFVLPPAFRPSAMVFVPADLCDAENGRLLVQPNGVVRIQAADSFADAQCFTSLEGVSFPKDQIGATSLSVENGWTNAPFNTRNAAVEEVNGVIRFSGAIRFGTDAQIATLPNAFRPVKNIFLPIDLCNSRKGRLLITPTGSVSVQSPNLFSEAQCFTSLEGASFLRNQGVTDLALLNGWTNYASGTRAAGVKIVDGVVHFRGGVANGTNDVLFTLPPAFRRANPGTVEVDLCDARKGRLTIYPDGTVNVTAEDEVFANAQCFTSLDGASIDL